MGYHYCGRCGTKDFCSFENPCCDINEEGDICDRCYEHMVRKTCKCGKNFCAKHGDHYNTDCCGHFLCENCLDENDHNPDPYGKEGGCTDCAAKQQKDDVEDALKLHDKPFVTRLLKKCKSESLQECLQDWLETVPSQPLKRRMDYDDSDDDDIIVIGDASDDDNQNTDEDEENADMEEDDENDVADNIVGLKKRKKKKSTENKKKLLPSSKKTAPKKKKGATKPAPQKKKAVTKTALPKKKKAATKPAPPKKKKAATKTVPKKKKPTKKSTGSRLAVGAEEEEFQPPAHVRKFFPGHGWFTGRVTTTTVGDEEMDRYVLHFDNDDEHEEISQQELRQLMEKAAIPIGAIGYEFVREYDDVFYSGKVVTININDRECAVSDGLNHDYTLDQLEEWDTLQNNNNSATCFTSNGNVNESNSVAKTSPKKKKSRVSSANDDELLFKPPSHVRKFFSGYGWFTGRITTTASTRFDRQYTIQYEDSDHEECSQQQLQHLIKEASMNVGDIGYQFVREYDGVFYSGKVKSICGDDGIRECYLSDRLYHNYTLGQLQEWRELQNDDASKVKKW